MSTAASSLDLDTFCARYLAAWNDHDPGAMAELVTEDIVWEDPALPGPARGVAAVQEFMRGSWVGFPDLRFDETDSPASHRGGRSGRVALADARHDERAAGPARVRADRPLDGGRGRRPVDDARRAHRALPRLLRHERPGAPARPSRRRPGAAPRRRWSRCSACRRGCSAAAGDDATSTPSSSARASPAARRRGCSRSAARAWRSSRGAPTSTPTRPSARTTSSPARRRRSRGWGSRRSSRSTARCATRSTCGRPTAAGSATAATRRTATTSRARCSIRSCAGMTAETPGVELLPGHTATELLGDGDGPRRRGRGSPRARAARCARGSSSPPTGATRTSRGWPACAGRVRPHNRFFYWAYWRGVRAGRRPLADVVHGARLRLHLPQRGRAVPASSSAPHRDRLPEFRADLEGAYLRYLAALPDAPDLSQRHARVQAAGQARPAERQPPGRAARAGLRGRRRARLRSAVGRRLRLGVPERRLARRGDRRRARRRRRPRRARSTPTARSTAAASGRTTSSSPTSPPRARANPLERAMYRSAATDDDVYRAFEAIGVAPPLARDAVRAAARWRAWRGAGP